MALEGLEGILLTVLVISSIIAVESERLIHSVLGFLVFTLTLGGLFILLSAYQLGLMVFLVYSGAAIALLLMVIMLTKGREGEG